MLTVSDAAVCQSEAAKDHSAMYDGRWWTAASQAERYGFIAGFTDCYKAERAGPTRFGARSLAAYRDSVSRYFARENSHLSEPVASVLPKFGDRLGEKPPRGGEEWREKHGYFDGSYWGQAFGDGGAGTAHQRGFVEGYLSCNQRLGVSRRPSFSAQPEMYVRRISQWYHFDSTTGDMDPAREEAKIADVLLRFRDRKR